MNPLQYHNTPLHYAARGGHTTCVEHLLSTPGINVNIKGEVSWYHRNHACEESVRILHVNTNYIRSLIRTNHIV